MSLRPSSTKSRTSRVQCLSVTCALCLARQCQESLPFDFCASTYGATPDPCCCSGSLRHPCGFCFPRVYHCTTWQPTNRTAAAQRLPAHDPSPYLRGERFLPLFFSAFTTSHAPRVLARSAPPSLLAAGVLLSDELREDVPRSSAPSWFHRSFFAVSARGAVRQPRLPLLRSPPSAASSLSPAERRLLRSPPPSG